MRKKKIVEKKPPDAVCTPSLDNTFYFYPRKRGFLTPVPYTWKPNYQYIKQILDADKRKN
jgi:hypothetical protein